MWKHVFHLNTSVEISFHKRLKEGGPRFNLVPRAFPWENGRGGDCFTSVPLLLFDSLYV